MSRGVIRVERNGLTKFSDGFRISLQLGVGDAEVEVGQGVGGFCGDNLFEQRSSGGVILAIERVLSLGQERSRGSMLQCFAAQRMHAAPQRE